MPTSTDSTNEALIDSAPAAEVGEVHLYHPKSWWTRYVFCQDAKVIAIQYSSTAVAIGLVALVLSWLMRLQLGFPDSFSFIDQECRTAAFRCRGIKVSDQFLFCAADRRNGR